MSHLPAAPKYGAAKYQIGLDNPAGRAARRGAIVKPKVFQKSP